MECVLSENIPGEKIIYTNIKNTLREIINKINSNQIKEKNGRKYCFELAQKILDVIDEKNYTEYLKSNKTDIDSLKLWDRRFHFCYQGLLLQKEFKLNKEEVNELLNLFFSKPLNKRQLAHLSFWISISINFENKIFLKCLTHYINECDSLQFPDTTLKAELIDISPEFCIAIINRGYFARSQSGRENVAIWLNKLSALLEENTINLTHVIQFFLFKNCSDYDLLYSILSMIMKKKCQPFKNHFLVNLAASVKTRKNKTELMDNFIQILIMAYTSKMCSNSNQLKNTLYEKLPYLKEIDLFVKPKQKKVTIKRKFFEESENEIEEYREIEVTPCKLFRMNKKQISKCNDLRIFDQDHEGFYIDILQDFQEEMKKRPELLKIPIIKKTVQEIEEKFRLLVTNIIIRRFSAFDSEFCPRIDIRGRFQNQEEMNAESQMEVDGKNQEEMDEESQDEMDEESQDETDEESQDETDKESQDETDDESQKELDLDNVLGNVTAVDSSEEMDDENKKTMKKKFDMFFYIMDTYINKMKNLEAHYKKERSKCLKELNQLENFFQKEIKKVESYCVEVEKNDDAMEAEPTMPVKKKDNAKRNRSPKGKKEIVKKRKIRKKGLKKN